MKSETEYRKLESLGREMSLLQSTAALLSWDQETQLPPAGIDFRARQSAYLAGRIHRMFTAAEVGDWIAACEESPREDGSVEAANVREWRRAFDRKTRLPVDLVEEFEETRTRALAAWQSARAASDFAAFRPHLARLVEMTRTMADCWGYDDCPYDALLEGYETGARTAPVRALLDALKPRVAALAAEAAAKASPLPEWLFAAPYPANLQAAFNREVAEAFGFDFNAGRIDASTHPFCSGIAPGDTRMTTRYDERDFRSSLYATLHECGHGMYEQGLPAGHFGTPMGDSISLGIHESQSRLWENHVGRGRAFWNRWLPRAAEFFPHLRAATPESMTAAVNHPRLSLIRVEADEVTYDLHIILRFEIETRLVSGELAVDGVPAAWNEMFEALTGLTVPDDAHGCLQDIHWSMGALGYFPTYTLGNLNAAQLFRAALAEDEGIASDLDNGRYGSLLGWLREKVHSQGSRHLPADLMEFATGEPTHAEYYIEHLRRRFL